MPLVVTGAAGFIGGHLVQALARRGHHVVGVDRRPDIPVAARSRIVADLLGPDPDGSLDDALAAADAVFHLAGRPGVRDESPGIEWRRLRDNVLATERVLARARRGTPVIVASSSSVYGGAAGGRPSREHDRPRPTGDYAVSKLEMERRCAQRAAAGGHVAVARPFTVAGEGQRSDMAIARWLDAARSGRPIRILGAPGRLRDITDVGDVVEGLVRMAERGVHGTLNLGTGAAHRLDRIAAAVCAAVGAAPEVVVEPASAEEPAATLADTGRCARLLGFVPRTDLDALVRRQAAAAPAVPRALELV